MKSKMLATMVVGFVMSVTLGSGVADAQFGSWNPVQDIAKGAEHLGRQVQNEGQKVIDTVAPVTAPVRQGRNRPAHCSGRYPLGPDPSVHSAHRDHASGDVGQRAATAADAGERAQSGRHHAG